MLSFIAIAGQNNFFSLRNIIFVTETKGRKMEVEKLLGKNAKQASLDISWNTFFANYSDSI